MTPLQLSICCSNLVVFIDGRYLSITNTKQIEYVSDINTRIHFQRNRVGTKLHLPIPSQKKKLREDNIYFINGSGIFLELFDITD